MKHPAPGDSTSKHPGVSPDTSFLKPPKPTVFRTAKGVRKHSDDVPMDTEIQAPVQPAPTFTFDPVGDAHGVIPYTFRDADNTPWAELAQYEAAVYYIHIRNVISPFVGRLHPRPPNSGPRVSVLLYKSDNLGGRRPTISGALVGRASQ